LCSKVIFYLIGCLATVGLAFSSWIVSAAFGFCISLWTEPLELRHTMMPGAVLATSWAISSGLFRLYVSNFGNFNQAYGAVGAVIVLMLWLYMSAVVL